MEVLIVDDDPAIRQVAQLGLERSGWTVTSASTGQEALDHLASHVPDVVLMDVMMPDMDGRALLRRLRGDPRWASLQVVAFSARHDLDDELMALGAAGVLGKPFDPLGLGQRLQDLLEDRA